MTFRKLVLALLAGGLAGIAALGLDELLDWLALDTVVVVAPRFVAVYALAGFLAALLIEIAVLARRRRPPGGMRRFAAVGVLLYAPAVFERVYQAVEVRQGPLAATASAALALLGLGAWILLLRRVGGSWTASFISATATVALGLSVHRNLIDQVFSPPALVANAAVLSVGLTMAFLARITPAWRVAAAASLAAAVSAVLMTARPSSPVLRNPASENPPNLLLVVIDTLRQDVFQAVIEETPEGRRLDERLAGAVWFERALAASPWTLPSMGSIMTGLYPREHGYGARSHVGELPGRLADSVPTLAETLSARGYRTEALVANPLLRPEDGIDRGFDRFEVLSGASVKLPLLTALVHARLLREDYYQAAGAVRRRLRSRLDDIAASGRPFFLWLQLMDPHGPLTRHPDLSPDPVSRRGPTQERLYRDEVRYCLDELARMLDQLATHGLWRHTLLVLVSDHGEMFPSDGHDSGVREPEGGQPISYGHGHALYRELVRVPLVIRPPGGLEATRRTDVLVTHVDLHDTVLDLLGVDARRIGRDRVSLVSWLGSELPAAPAERSQVLMSAAQHGQRAIETRTYKLIDYRPEAGRGRELYDLADDPQERRNLASQRPELLAESARLLEAFWSTQSEPPGTVPVADDSETTKRLRALGYLQ